MMEDAEFNLKKASLSGEMGFLMRMPDGDLASIRSFTIGN